MTPQIRLWENIRVKLTTVEVSTSFQSNKWSTIVIYNFRVVGSGCGSVGGAVASHSRGPRFESSHWQHVILNIYYQLYREDENKEKDLGMAHFYNFRVMWTFKLHIVVTKGYDKSPYP